MTLWVKKNVFASPLQILPGSRGIWAAAFGEDVIFFKFYLV